MIERQIDGHPDLNYDPDAGVPVVAPWLSWGPYLWADGINPRSDGFTWLQGDMVMDCTHPSASGRAKVACLLLEFFSTDSTTKDWFLEAPGELNCHHIFLPAITSAGFNPLQLLINRWADFIKSAHCIVYPLSCSETIGDNLKNKF
jgi:hypothetical protein